MGQTVGGVDGGAYADKGEDFTASSRAGNAPYNEKENTGFRVALFVNDSE